MAREDYWNRGRVEGLQKSTALDTLERILGITGNVAGNIQQNRQKRGEAFQVRLSSMLDIGRNREAIHKRSFDNDTLTQLKANLIEELGEGSKRVDLTTRELYNNYLKEIDAQMELNTTYNEIDKPWFANAEDELMTMVYEYVDNQGSNSFDHMGKMSEIGEHINNYVKKKQQLFSKYGDKLAYDMALQNDMASFVFSSNKFLSTLKGDAQRGAAAIPDPLLDFLITGLSSNDPTIAQRAAQAYDQQQSSIFTSNFNAAEGDVLEFTNDIKVLTMQANQWANDNNGNTSNWAKWGDYNTAMTKLNDAYNTFYNVAGQRHVNDPLHQGKIDEYLQSIRPDWMTDPDAINGMNNIEKIILKIEKAQSQDEVEALQKELNDTINNTLNVYFKKYTTGRKDQFNRKGDVYIPDRAWRKTMNEFKIEFMKSIGI